MPNYRQHFGFSDLLIFAPLIVWPDGTSKEDPSQTPCFSLFGESPLLALLLCVPPLMLWRALPLKTPERATWLTVVYIFHAACPALCRQFRIVKSILGANCATGKWTGGRGLYRRQASKVLTGVDHAAFLYTEASYGYALAEKGRFLASPQNFCMQNIRTIDQEKPRKRRQLPHSFRQAWSSWWNHLHLRKRACATSPGASGMCVVHLLLCTCVAPSTFCKHQDPHPSFGCFWRSPRWLACSPTRSCFWPCPYSAACKKGW